ncbi:MAG TPA: hypothetical protein VFK56_19005 [Mycobacterium sp.]|nr:hypothetical protein [Mycobacterium sp.]
MYARTESETFWDSVDLLSKRLGRDASARDAIETHIAERGLRGAVARRVRQELQAEVEAAAPGRIEDQSLSWLALDEVFSGELLGDLPRGGYRSVVECWPPDSTSGATRRSSPLRSTREASVSTA